MPLEDHFAFLEFNADKMILNSTRTKGHIETYNKNRCVN